MVTYDFHSDGDPPEKGGTRASITRTLIICFDCGHVNFQIAGYTVLMYDQFISPHFIEMPPDVVHRSKHTAVNVGDLEGGRALVQRKLVIHMGPKSTNESPVDWTGMCSQEELSQLEMVTAALV
jgi:hypothetical protein